MKRKHGPVPSYAMKVQREESFSRLLRGVLSSCLGLSCQAYSPVSLNNKTPHRGVIWLLGERPDKNRGPKTRTRGHSHERDSYGNTYKAQGTRRKRVQEECKSQGLERCFSG